MIKNRLEKNYKKLKPWALRNHIEAFRLYDRDIPEFPFIVDIYKDFFLVYDKSIESIDKEKGHLPILLTAIKELFSVDDSHLILKRRERQKGLNQYQKFSEDKDYFPVQEGSAFFWVNLFDYLDTGLFLDHRPMRYKIYKMAKNKKVLNLFCYTGSVSVFAALGGASEVHSVDLSNTYLDWAKENFSLNKLDIETASKVDSSVVNNLISDKSTKTNSEGKYFFHQADVLQWIKDQVASVEGALGQSKIVKKLSKDIVKADITASDSKKFDIIFLDPPTFSNSKRMQSDFEVEKDQEFLVDHCMRLLSDNGVLFFSNNKRKFKLNDSLPKRYLVKDITQDSIPIDYHDQKIHQCYEIRGLPKANINSNN